MATKIVYNNLPTLVLLCGNMVRLNPKGMAKDHAELSDEQQKDPGVVKWAAEGKILVLSMDEAAKREGRRSPAAAAPSKPSKTSVTNPAAPPAEKKPEKKAEPAPEPEKVPEKESKPAEKTETAEAEKPEEDDGSSDKKKKSKKSRRG